MMLEGRVALVTGSSRGLGRAIAVALAAAGAAVAVHYRQSHAQAKDAVDEILRGGGRALPVQADVSDPADVQRLVATVQEGLGPVDILVNNAGIAAPVPLEDVTLELFDAMLSANLRSAFLVTTAVLPGMRQRRWGRLIFLSSVAAQIGGIVGPHYAASKAGMDGLMRSYASLLAKEGITSNSICPALIASDMLSGNPRANPSLVPVGRFGRPEEVADAAVMLAGNGYITGQCINVNGGMYFG
jgi:3-oxoacyl-[acyl-carrier protein] reductase